ncbi:hypothetical protein Tco_0296522 [Tanacetum coccineum]
MLEVVYGIDHGYSPKAQQKALDDDLVAPANRLQTGKCNLRLNSTLKSKEPTLQVVLDALKLTSFYKAFEINADVPKIYMQEFWVTASRHHSSLRFKMNKKSHTVNVDNFRDMLQICPKLPSQKFEDPPFKEEILSFIRDLGHTGEIKVLSDVNVNQMHQPWRSFAAIINKCLSKRLLLTPRKSFNITTALQRTSHTMEKQDLWHTARDDPMFTTIRVISKHQDTQIYGVILPQHLTNQSMLESEAYKTYHAYATGADEGTGVSLGVLDVPTYNSDDEQISWKSSDEDNDDEVNVMKMMMIKMMTMMMKKKYGPEDEAYDEETQVANDEKKRWMKKRCLMLQATQVNEETHMIITASLLIVNIRVLRIIRKHLQHAQIQIHRYRISPGSKRRRARKEPIQTSASKEKTSKSTGKSKEGSKYHQKSTGKSAQAEEPIHADEDLEI